MYMYQLQIIVLVSQLYSYICELLILLSFFLIDRMIHCKFAYNIGKLKHSGYEKKG